MNWVKGVLATTAYGLPSVLLIFLAVAYLVSKTHLVTRGIELQPALMIAAALLGLSYVVGTGIEYIVEHVRK